jgi:hypothetical protein
VEVEEEIAAIVVGVGVKVDEVAEEEVGARPRWGIGGTRKPLCFHETILKQRYPGFAIFLEYRTCMTFADEALYNNRARCWCRCDGASGCRSGAILASKTGTAVAAK